MAGYAITRGLVVAFLVAATGPAAWAQTPDGTVSEMTRRADAAGVPTAVRDAAIGIVTAARTDGLPVGPLADKFLEGVSKHVDGGRILAVMRTIRARMGRARSLLLGAVTLGATGHPSADDVIRVAAVLGDGVPPEDVAGLTAAAGPSHRPVSRVTEAAEVLDRLRSMGVYVGAAPQAIEAAVAAGYGPADLARIPDDYRRQAMAGGSAKAFFEALAARIRSSGLGHTGLGSSGAGKAAQGQAPGEQAGASSSNVPDVDAMGSAAGNHGKGNPYAGDRPSPGNGYGHGGNPNPPKGGP